MARSGQDATGFERSNPRKLVRAEATELDNLFECAQVRRARSLTGGVLLQKLEDALDDAIKAVDAATGDPRAEPEDVAAVRHLARHRSMRAVQEPQCLHYGYRRGRRR